MLLFIGYVIVLGATLGGFLIAGGHPMLLMHASEFIVIGGIALGVVVISTPKDVLSKLMKQIKESFKGSGVKSDEYLDLLKLLYELFLQARRDGLIALDDHLSEPVNSAILSKYPSFLNEPKRVEFLCNSLRPVIDGKIKPDQLQGLLDSEINAMREENKGPEGVIHLVGDSLPGIGIVAAVLGIINTMAAISEGPEKVGEKVAAALTGTFLGILGAYGFINPLGQRIQFNEEAHLMYYKVIAQSVTGFTKGLAPIMAIEVARRTLGKAVDIGSDELEQILKALNNKE
tara:strand:- start:607 stop:1470 length:864 start_codon:yes stop_codon:yes gene_type:complete